MDASTFDHLARTLVTRGSRRTALGAVMAAGAALGLAGTHRATAQRCKGNGRRCKRNSECCSGRCHRNRKVCRQADNQGICTVRMDRCTGIGQFACGNGCQCYVTTTGRSFCGNLVVIRPEDCDCASNQECEERLGPGAKCVAIAANPLGPCANCGAARSGCMPPCENPDPPA